MPRRWQYPSITSPLVVPPDKIEWESTPPPPIATVDFRPPANDFLDLKLVTHVPFVHEQLSEPRRPLPRPIDTGFFLNDFDDEFIYVPERRDDLFDLPWRPKPRWEFPWQGEAENVVWIDERDEMPARPLPRQYPRSDLPEPDVPVPPIDWWEPHQMPFRLPRMLDRMDRLDPEPIPDVALPPFIFDRWHLVRKPPHIIEWWRFPWEGEVEEVLPDKYEAPRWQPLWIPPSPTFFVPKEGEDREEPLHFIDVMGLPVRKPPYTPEFPDFPWEGEAENVLYFWNYWTRPWPTPWIIYKNEFVPEPIPDVPGLEFPQERREYPFYLFTVREKHEFLYFDEFPGEPLPAPLPFPPPSGEVTPCPPKCLRRPDLKC
jgi:hypothetical protein